MKNLKKHVQTFQPFENKMNKSYSTWKEKHGRKDFHKKYLLVEKSNTYRFQLVVSSN